MQTRLQELEIFLNKNLFLKEAKEVHRMVRQENLTKNTYDIINNINKRMKQAFPRDFDGNPSRIFGNKFLNHILNNYNISKSISNNKLKKMVYDFSERKTYDIAHYFRDDFIYKFYVPFILNIFNINFSEFPEIIEWTSVSISKIFGRADWESYYEDGANVTRFMQDLLHEMHHAITHPVAYKKFTEKGFIMGDYNFLDIIEEVLVSSIDSVYNKDFSGKKTVDWEQLDYILKSRYGIEMPLSPDSRDSMIDLIEAESKEGDRDKDLLIEDKLTFAKAIINEAFDTNAVSLIPTAKKLWKTFSFKNNESFLTNEKEKALIKFLKDVDNSMPEIEQKFNEVYEECIGYYSSLFIEENPGLLQDE